MKLFKAVLFFLFYSSVIQGQAPGLVIQTGITTSYSKDFNITNNKGLHYGWMVGADARILDGDMYFIVGGQYHATGLRSTTTPDFFKNNDWSLLHGRVGLGFNIFRINEKVTFRSKLLGSVNFLIDAPSKALNIPDYELLNDSFLGAVTGLGVTIGMIDIDVDFQYGLINAYNKRPESTFDIWTLMVGFHF